MRSVRGPFAPGPHGGGESSGGGDGYRDVAGRFSQDGHSDGKHPDVDRPGDVYCDGDRDGGPTAKQDTVTLTVQ
jgi:hypothetical protein